jgi:hypothetical protein
MNILYINFFKSYLDKFIDKNIQDFNLEDLQLNILAKYVKHDASESDVVELKERLNLNQMIRFNN